MRNVAILTELTNIRFASVGCRNHFMETAMTKHHPFCWLAMSLLASVAASNVAAQSWLDPALNEPLPQYRSMGAPAMPAARYPLEQPEAEYAQPVQEALQSPDPTISVFVNPPPQQPASTPLPSLPPAKATAIRKEQKTKDPKLATKIAKKKRTPVVDYSIYRDYSAYPIDPRKPCSPCTGGPQCRCGRCRGLGNHGKPYQERELGGCECGKQKFPRRHPQFSVYWPRPFSAKLDERNPQSAAARYSGCQPKRCVDAFDHLIDFRLVNYQRTDNGYCGPELDPYGCLGEQASLNAGIGYRVAEVPIERYPASKR